MVTQKVSDLVITRIIDAPVEMVWKAWTEPENLMRWWGPKDFTSPACKLDLRVGGKYLFCMRDPDGKDYWSTGVFQEIIPLKRLVYTDSFADPDGKVVSASFYGMEGSYPKELLVIVTFEALDGKTQMTLKHSGIPEGQHKEMAGLGWNESIEKLAASLKVEGGSMNKLKMTVLPGKQEFTYTRTFNAPRELVFKIFTDPTLVPQWWGPRNIITKVDKMDVRPGGEWRYIQRDQQGMEFSFHGVYHAIEPSRQIINTFEYEGVPGHVSLETLKFEEANGITTLTGQMVFQSVADRDGMVDTGAETGMKDLMDRLEEVLERIRV